MHGFNTKAVFEILRAANQRHGVLLGIGHSILGLTILPPLEFHDEVRIYLPDGMDMKYVTGIMPLGEAEKTMLSTFCTLNPVLG